MVVGLLQTCVDRGDVQTVSVALACIGERLLARMYVPPKVTTKDHDSGKEQEEGKATAEAEGKVQGKGQRQGQGQGDGKGNGRAARGGSAAGRWLGPKQVWRWQQAYIDILQVGVDLL
jgi:hypothetical protein